MSKRDFDFLEGKVVVTEVYAPTASWCINIKPFPNNDELQFIKCLVDQRTTTKPGMRVMWKKGDPSE